MPIHRRLLFVPLLFVPLLLLAACTPPRPTPDQARDALVVRMERPGERRIKVDRVEVFELSDCREPDKGPGVMCAVRMDVSFAIDGQPMRSDEAQAVRFVRESGNWVAYPE